MAKFEVGQRVKVVDMASPHHGRIGKVNAITPEQAGFLYGLMFDFVDNPKLPPVGRFNEEQLEAVD